MKCQLILSHMLLRRLVLAIAHGVDLPWSTSKALLLLLLLARSILFVWLEVDLFDFCLDGVSVLLSGEL